MPLDALEGSAYSLPQKQSWDVVSDLDQLTTLEVASLAHSSSIPIEVWIKVVRAHNMKQRAKEEQQIVKTEMANVEESLKEEQTCGYS